VPPPVPAGHPTSSLPSAQLGVPSQRLAAEMHSPLVHAAWPAVQPEAAQLASSLPSAQFGVPSQKLIAGMHCPLTHAAWSAPHALGPVVEGALASSEQATRVHVARQRVEPSKRNRIGCSWVVPVGQVAQAWWRAS
jgi:hypothetical protein